MDAAELIFTLRLKTPVWMMLGSWALVGCQTPSTTAPSLLPSPNAMEPAMVAKPPTHRHPFEGLIPDVQPFEFEDQGVLDAPEHPQAEHPPELPPKLLVELGDAHSQAVPDLAPREHANGIGTPEPLVKIGKTSPPSQQLNSDERRLETPESTPIRLPDIEPPLLTTDSPLQIALTQIHLGFLPSGAWMAAQSTSVSAISAPPKAFSTQEKSMTANSIPESPLPSPEASSLESISNVTQASQAALPAEEEVLEARIPFSPPFLYLSEMDVNTGHVAMYFTAYPAWNYWIEYSHDLFGWITLSSRMEVTEIQTVWFEDSFMEYGRNPRQGYYRVRCTQN